MLYLATPSSEATVDAMIDGRIGLIDTPAQGTATRIARAHVGGVTWCADNGAYSDKWVEGKWWSWLSADRQLGNLERCLFATAPDVVGDAEATWERSRPWLPRIRELGYPVAYVGQNGLGDLPWEEFDVLFLGGSLECVPCGYVWSREVKPKRRQPCPTCGRIMGEWKLGAVAREATAEAVRRGMPVHMGRVSSAKRFAYARSIGCASVDGTFLTYGADIRLPELLSWTRQLDSPYLV